MIKPFTGVSQQRLTCFVGDDLLDLFVSAKYDVMTGSIMITEVWDGFDNIIDDLSDSDINSILELFIEKELER